jgi:hypothetical protein
MFGRRASSSGVTLKSLVSSAMEKRGSNLGEKLKRQAEGGDYLTKQKEAKEKADKKRARRRSKFQFDGNKDKVT